MSCCDELTLELYREGLLESAEADAIAAHLLNCAACQQRLADLDQEDLLLTAALALSPEERAALAAADLPGRVAEQVRQSHRQEWLWGGLLVSILVGASAGFAEVVQPFLKHWGLIGPGAENPVVAALGDLLFRLLSLRRSGGQSNLLIPLLLLGLMVILLSGRGRRRSAQDQ